MNKINKNTYEKNSMANFFSRITSSIASTCKSAANYAAQKCSDAKNYGVSSCKSACNGVAGYVSQKCSDAKNFCVRKFDDTVNTVLLEPVVDYMTRRSVRKGIEKGVRDAVAKKVGLDSQDFMGAIGTDIAHAFARGFDKAPSSDQMTALTERVGAKVANIVAYGNYRDAKDLARQVHDALDRDKDRTLRYINPSRGRDGYEFKPQQIDEMIEKVTAKIQQKYEGIPSSIRRSAERRYEAEGPTIPVEDPSHARTNGKQTASLGQGQQMEFAPGMTPTVAQGKQAGVSI